jgi:hydrogenase maturation protein HypF
MTPPSIDRPSGVRVSGRRIEIRGTVQGVGFRPWIHRVAVEHGLVGFVRNTSSGVAIEVFGPDAVLDAFMIRLASSAPPAAVIQQVRSSAIPAQPLETFSIAHGNEHADRRVSIPADLPTCDACLAELFDPANRRYRYPFINCTSCGPRFTIAHDVPYDRHTTTMAAFQMCAECQLEYDSPGDRRFHAQPNACPACGPQIALVHADGKVVEPDDPFRKSLRYPVDHVTPRHRGTENTKELLSVPRSLCMSESSTRLTSRVIASVTGALLAGQIVALKGLGGFHLACDATSSDAVRRLRARKRRDEKPFAVMVQDLPGAREVAMLADEEQQLLESTARPIVLTTRRPGCALAPEVAPDNPLVGLLLPYTPLHHLIMREVRRPIVMTSGNLSEEPIAYRNDEALTRLKNIADLFLMHDRDIETPCDDSVARIIDGHPAVLRRARGHVPRPITVDSAFERPVLACGALLKNTFCIGIDDAAYLGPHIGDLENLNTYQSFETSIARMERFIGVTPAIIAYDLHPDYLSTRYALTRPETVKIGVQHHHAHVASVMAERGLRGPVIGVAYDGTGYGTDGAAWGGEVLFARYDSFERVATLRPIPLAGGDAAIRQVWRIALALVEDAFDWHAPVDSLRLFSLVRARDLAVVREMITARVRSPLAHGCGRYFDGIGSLVLMRLEARHEGQIALEWNVIADPSDDSRYEYQVDWQQSPWTIDLRPMVRAVVHDVLAGVPPASISARFHNTIVAATTDVVHAAASIHGAVPVVLSGGCFQNPRLTERLAAALRPQFPVYLHGAVPPGDGGLALGQAVVAAAVARRLPARGAPGLSRPEPVEGRPAVCEGKEKGHVSGGSREDR